MKYPFKALSCSQAWLFASKIIKITPKRSKKVHVTLCWPSPQIVRYYLNGSCLQKFLWGEISFWAMARIRWDRHKTVPLFQTSSDKEPKKSFRCFRSNEEYFRIKMILDTYLCPCSEFWLLTIGSAPAWTLRQNQLRILKKTLLYDYFRHLIVL